MKKMLFNGAFCLLLFPHDAMAVCASYPNTLTNGTTADAAQVMQNFACAALTSGSTLNATTLTGTTSMTGAVGIGTASPAVPLHLQINSGSVTAIVQEIEGTGSSGYSGGLAFNVNPSGGGHYTAGEITGENSNNSGASDGGSIGIWTAAQDGSHTLTRRVTIDASGNVGVNTATPGAALEAVGGNSLRLRRPSENYADISFTGGAVSGDAIDLVFAAGNLESNGYQFRTFNGSSNVSALSIDRNGNVGIGTTAPGYMLHVNGSVAGVGAYIALSDGRYKKDVITLSNGAVDKVMKLRPVTYFWKQPKDGGMQGRQTGFIAQEVEKVLPSVVLTQRNKEKTKSLKYNELIAVLTKAMQEQQAEISALKAANDNQVLETVRLRAAMGSLEHKVAIQTAQK